MKAPLLLVSGWAHTAEDLDPLTERLPHDRPARVLGINDLAGGPSYAAGLIREMGREPCVLVGWSMGGMIALEAAAAEPKRVAALVMISSAPRLAAAPDFTEGVPPRTLQAMEQAFRRAPERTLVDFFRNASYPNFPGEDAAGEFANRALAAGADRLAAQLKYLAHAELRPLWTALSIPRLLIHGCRDRIIPIGAAEWMFSRRRGTILDTFTDAGHRLPLDHPDWTAEPLLRFLETLS
ncbi:MAG: alpha/beta fold hydrolase [Kiritimatiellae bacterium]|nr:alpha/beta fold hydrolase [Kiritimatiellia bacterium]